MIIERGALRESIGTALWDATRGYDGRILTGDFAPGHDDVVQEVLMAVIDALKDMEAGQ